MKKHRQRSKRPNRRNAREPIDDTAGKQSHTRPSEGQRHNATFVKPTASRRRGVRTMAIGLISAAVAIVGCLASIANLLPRVAVDPLFTWDAHDPLTTEFAVKNSGYVRLMDVRCACLFFSANGVHLKRPDQAGSADMFLGFHTPTHLR
jgi:phosphoribosylpyrophosphate synthetase